MSPSDQVYPDYVKVPNTPVEKPADVEQGPPSYPLAENEELVVGGGRSRCESWRFFRRNRNNNVNSCTKTRRRRRIFAWVFASIIVISLVHFVSVGIKAHKAFKSVKCVAITPTPGTAGELEFTLPLTHSSSSLLVHDSLTGGDSSITRDSDVKNGTVHLRLKFAKHGKDANDDKPDQVYDGCMVQFKSGTGVALIPRDCHGARAKISSLALTFPSSVTSPSVAFLGKDKHLSDRKLRKFIRWWRKHHDKKDKKDLGLVTETPA